MDDSRLNRGLRCVEPATSRLCSKGTFVTVQLNELVGTAANFLH
jgi:hypothetical protein